MFPIFNRLRSILFLFLAGLIVFCGFAHTDDGFRPALASYSISPSTVPPGSAIRYYFEFTNQGDSAQTEENIFLHFIDPQSPNVIKWQADHVPPVPTPYWSQGEIIEDGPFNVDVPENTPDGVYGVRVGLWDPGSGKRSLDEILPVTVTIDRNAKVGIPTAPKPLPNDRAQRRLRSMNLRFQAGNIVTLENKTASFRIDPARGIFSLTHTGTGEVWQSLPQTKRLGSIRASFNGKKVQLPIDNLRIVKVNRRQCVLAKDREGTAALELTFKLEANDPAITVSWRAGENWTVDQVEFDALAWTTNTLGGGAIIPRLMGQYFRADSPIEFRRNYKTYNGWGGLHIPMSAMMRENGSALLSWDSPFVSVACKLRSTKSESIPGTTLLTLGLQCSSAARSFRIDLTNGHTYADVAQAYRPLARRHGNLVTWKKRSGRRKIASKLFGAAEFKPFVLSRRLIEENGKTTEQISNPYSAEDCLTLLKHLHGDLELDRVLFVLAGWIHRGYDNQHPDILPAAPEIGGDEGVRQISELARSYGYLFGLHDNYQDMYKDAPSWNPGMIMKTRDGRLRKGGVWAGGQAWLIASDWGLQLAKRNLPDVKERYAPNAYFIDTTFAAPLYESFDPDTPLTRDADLKYNQDLFKYTA